MALNPKLYYIYKLSTFATFTEHENELYEDARKNDKSAKQKLNKSLSDITFKRSIRNSALIKKDGAYNEKSIIGISENEVLRWIIKKNPSYIKTIVGGKKLIEGIVFLKVCHNEILKSIIQNGLLIDGMEYHLFTAGAGQQRNNEVTLLEKSILDKFKSWYACGLTDEFINDRGGMNTGKYLAYCALPLSSSCSIKVDVDRIIVVPDLEISVDKPVEYVDVETFESRITTLKALDKKINQTDGCGMILPSTMREIEQQLSLDYSISGIQIRAPWIKGLLAPFDFKRFCVIKGSSIVRDIYGIEHDILAEDIQIILTASQFKAWKLYNDFDEYKRHFNANSLSFSATNVSNPPKEISEVNYQFLQTLDREKATPEAISALCAKSVEHLKALRHDKSAVLEVFGAVKENKNPKPLQEALLLYPALLRDEAIRHNVERKITKCKKLYKAGHLLAEGHFGYVMPDMYGFCEFIFEGNENPAGLLSNNSVYCRYYQGRDINEVDCLRAPHFRESDHAVRKLYQSDECAEWFSDCGQNIIYSLRDYLMLTLTGDADGDTVFITPERAILDLITPDTVPLSYDMAKAPAQEINMESVYQTIVSSFACNDIKEGNTIGLISNAITKIWNADVITPEDAELIKGLVIFNNYQIDFPKTQKSIELPADIQAHYRQLDNVKCPYFFQWAKGKKSTEPCNNSIVNLTAKCIDAVPNSRYIYFKKEKSLDYSMLQRRLEDGRIMGVDRYSKTYKNVHAACIRFGNEVQSIMREINDTRKKQADPQEYNYDLRYALYLVELRSICDDDICLANILVDIHYNQKPVANMHQILWSCVGEVLVESIRINLGCNDYVPLCRERKAYIKRNLDCNKAISLLKEARSSIDQKKTVVYEQDLEHVKYVKGEKERKVYFTLLCLCKQNANHSVHLVSSPNHLNKTKLARLAGLEVGQKKSSTISKHEVISKSSLTVNMERVFRELSDNGFIKIHDAHKKGKIISLPNYDFQQKGLAKCVLDPQVSPCVYYASLFNGKKLASCEICGRSFVSIGHAKTCSYNCSSILAKRTEAECNSKQKCS